jgi:5-methylcytosine-specific restriction protein A
MAVERIRGARLQRIRHFHLLAEPLCRMCAAKGKATRAVEVDHIVALCNGGSESQDNRQSLCVACHQDKTAQDMGYRVKQEIGLDGWPVEKRGLE